jgi:hypothetical protein
VEYTEAGMVVISQSCRSVIILSGSYMRDFDADRFFVGARESGASAGCAGHQTNVLSVFETAEAVTRLCRSRNATCSLTALNLCQEIVMSSSLVPFIVHNQPRRV